MRIVIEETDFRRLSPRTQAELLETIAGRSVGDLAKDEPRRTFRWRQPIDLTDDLAVRLLHGLAPNHRRRLELFARNGGRVTMKQLLAVTGDEDIRALSYFQGAINRKLRRLLNDHEKKVHLIGWDYDATEWDKDHRVIVDGVYYVTDASAKALQAYFGAG